MNKETLCKHLLQWLKTFSVPYPHSKIEEVSDGIALAHVLSQIAPDWFDDNWLTKIKHNVGNNWRMKVSNLKKILQTILEYYSDVLNLSIHNFSFPNVQKIGEAGDPIELAKFLQLILGCAVNCEKKQYYIEVIMGMEEIVQQAIMDAIQELMTKESFSNTVESLSSLDPHVHRLTMEIESLKEERETYMQKCHELDNQISVLNEEKTAIFNENEKLLQKMKSFECTNDTPNKISYLRQQIETLREEVDKLENAKEESKIKSEKLEKENQELLTKVEGLQSAAESARQQQDELDILRESQAKYQAQESSIAQYKKKLEELSDTKRQLKIVKDENTEYMQKNSDLKEELMKTGSLKLHLDIYKKQVSELQTKLGEETKRADKCEFEVQKITEKLIALQREKECLMSERDTLKENFEELKCSTLHVTSSSRNHHIPAEHLGIIPIDLREQFDRSKLEMKELKEKKAAEIGVLQVQIEQLQEREAELTSDNRIAHRRIVELESQLQEQQIRVVPKVGLEDSTISKLRKEVLERDNLLKDKELLIQSLEETLEKKEHNMHVMEERYKKYLDKAKMIIKSLGSSENSAASPEGSNLISQVLEKEKIIENLERDAARRKASRDEEEKLIATAFHSLGLQLDRNSMEKRFHILTGQSFLSKQRQASSRKISGPI